MLRGTLELISDYEAIGFEALIFTTNGHLDNPVRRGELTFYAFPGIGIGNATSGVMQARGATPNPPYEATR